MIGNGTSRRGSIGGVEKESEGIRVFESCAEVTLLSDRQKTDGRQTDKTTLAFGF